MFGGSKEGIGAAAGQTPGVNTANMSSPYLNFNPAYLTQGDDNYLYLENSTGHKGRGRFELMFNTIGGFTLSGGILGGLNGAFAGINQTQTLQGAARRTQMINFVAKRTASWAQMCGVVALMYSGIGTIISYSRGHDDELNTLAAGTLSGLLFKSTAGVRGCLKGGAVGMGVTTAYILYTSKDKVQRMIGR